LYILLVGTAEVFETMNAKNTDERQLKREIRWAREALAIAEMQEQSMSYHGIAESRKECIPFEYRHMAEWDSDDISEFIERTERDIAHVQDGEWE